MLAPLGGISDACSPNVPSPAPNQAWRLMDSWQGMRAPNAHRYKTGGSGLDPDLACLRSVSPCMKAFLPRERDLAIDGQMRSDEHTSELQTLMRISYDVL